MMKKNLINDVIQEMIPFLNNAQVERLQGRIMSAVKIAVKMINELRERTECYIRDA